MSSRHRLAAALERVAQLLPAQGPIGIFIHHNTLHAFEERPFEQAVVEGGELFGCEPFLAEEDYRSAIRRGRIVSAALDQVVAVELGAEASRELGAGATMAEALRALLVHGVPPARGRHLSWLLDERMARCRLRPDVPRRSRWRILDGTDGASAAEAERVEALWIACRAAAARAPLPRGAEREPPQRLRDLLLDGYGLDTDEHVNPLLIRLSAAFLDQGVAYWPMPARDEGFHASFVMLYGCAALPPPERWARSLVLLIDDDRRHHRDGNDSLLHSLGALGIEEENWAGYLTTTALALRGWAGMMWQLQRRPDRVPVHAPPATLADFLAVRLLIERAVLAQTARDEIGWDGDLAELRARLRDGWRPPPGPSQAERAWPLFHTAQLLGWRALDVDNLRPTALGDTFELLERYSNVEARRLLHLAYEASFHDAVLGALASSHASSPPPPRVQAIFCIDEREESLRRHLEEIDPAVETFGFAGFFGVAMYFRGIDDAHARPLCPVAVTPEHEVREVPQPATAAPVALLRRAHRGLSRGAHNVAVGSRTLLRGTIIAALAGVISAIPLVLRVMVPRLAAALRRRGRAALRPPPETELTLTRSAEPPSLGKWTGFTAEEMAAIVGRVLEDIGLAHRIAPLVLVVGHGSTSLNNPQESAHDCGACGGGHGGPNARAFARMANDPRVRQLLDSRGIRIPPGTWFVGGEHNTCHDGLELYDLERAPRAARAAISALEPALQRARARNAHERCRRFASAPTWLTPGLALAHVQSRAQDLAQPRPEYGHATAAVCVIGRRARTRGLFLDRRAFLVSYDPSDDADGSILARVMGAAVPVVAGISLEYYFGYVDPSGYGCGTKLPHNVTALLGVMDGHRSDLRPGLPWQMVEIHEPMRLLVVVEAPAERVAATVAAIPELNRLVAHRWILLHAVDPQSGRVAAVEGSQIQNAAMPSPELARAPSSAAWYGGRRGHLPIARIEPAT